MLEPDFLWIEKLKLIWNKTKAWKINPKRKKYMSVQQIKFASDACDYKTITQIYKQLRIMRKLYNRKNLHNYRRVYNVSTIEEDAKEKM